MVSRDSFCKIAGRVWNVRIIDLKNNFSGIDGENAGRTIAEGAPMILDPLGTFHYYTVTFARQGGAVDEFDELYNLLAYPYSQGLDVEIVFNQTMIAFKAYCRNGERGLTKIGMDGIVYWDTFQAQLTAMTAQVLPGQTTGVFVPTLVDLEDII